VREQYQGGTIRRATRLAAALGESLEYADANPDEVRDIIPTYTEIDEELLEDIRRDLLPPLLATTARIEADLEVAGRGVSA
jgi:ABC-type nitrate/sulfonate/bicarbonate transport system substrate-binding protein